jgi:hypothetical protein
VVKVARFQIKADEDNILPAWVDRSVKMPPALRKPSRKMLDGSGRFEAACRFEPDGILSFPKKKKNGNRLSSNAAIRKSVKDNAAKWKIGHCADVLPKIKLDASDLTV